MARWLAPSVFCGLVAAQSAAAAADLDQSVATRADHQPSFNFRLIEEPRLSARPIHNSGIVAQAEVGPNAAIGFGLLKSAQRKPDAGEFRLEGRSGGSRKAAVQFLWKF